MTLDAFPDAELTGEVRTSRRSRNPVRRGALPGDCSTDCRRISPCALG